MNKNKIPCLTNFFLISILSFLTFFPFNGTWALGIKQVNLSLGQWHEWVGETQKKAGGTNSSYFDCLSLTCAPNPVLKASLDFFSRDSLFPNASSQLIQDTSWSLRTEFSYVTHYPNWRKDYSRYQFFLSVLSLWEWREKWQAGFGSSLSIQNISGDGGEVVLDNGNSTSTFYQPSDNSMSLNQTLDLYLSYQFHPRWSTHIQNYIFRPFHSELRQYSVGLFFNYRWDIAEFHL